MKLINLAQAQDAGAKAAAEAQSFVDKVNDVILFPLITLLMGVAFLIFLWGCAEFIFGANNDQARAQGKKHVLWGIIGLVVMVSAMAILSIAAGTFGLGQQLDCASGEGGNECGTVFTVPNPSTNPPAQPTTPNPSTNPPAQPTTPNPSGNPPAVYDTDR